MKSLVISSPPYAHTHETIAFNMYWEKNKVWKTNSDPLFTKADCWQTNIFSEITYHHPKLTDGLCLLNIFEFSMALLPV